MNHLRSGSSTNNEKNWSAIPIAIPKITTYEKYFGKFKPIYFRLTRRIRNEISTSKNSVKITRLFGIISATRPITMKNIRSNSQPISQILRFSGGSCDLESVIILKNSKNP